MTERLKLDGPKPAADSQEEQAKRATCVVAICRITGYLCTSAVQEKGPKRTYAVASMTSWLRKMGPSPFILQSDWEPSL